MIYFKAMKDDELLNLAKKASENAYAPYSNFPVGACVLCSDESYYLGCNVENASYPLGICAERNAITTAICEGKKDKITAIAIFCPQKKLCSPCGACRQVIYEFGENIKIILQDEDNLPKTYTIKELLPLGFNF